MHYAQSLSCHEKLKSRPEQIEPCGSGAARQKIRGDRELTDHDRVTWEYTSTVLRLPPGFADDQVAAVIRVYNDAHRDGEEEGRAELRRELRDLIGAARED